MPGTRFLSYSGVFAYSPFRASINEERILDRIDSNRLLFFYESTLLGSYLSFSASLAWAEEPLKRHARVSDGDAAVRSLGIFLCIWVDRLVLVTLGRSSRWKKCACDRHHFF